MRKQPHPTLMALHTRRKLLQAATALTAVLAGCNGFSGSASHSETVAAGGAAPPDSSETEPPQLVARAGIEQAPIRLVDPDAETPEDDWDRPGPRVAHGIIDSREKADRLIIADGVETVDADDLASFVEETDFDSETLYLETDAIRECFQLELCWVSWQPNEIHTDYVRTLRSYDEACSVDARIFESRLIRLPVALDADSVNSFGSTIGSGRCERGGGE